jgi:hypothetical protein
VEVIVVLAVVRGGAWRRRSRGQGVGVLVFAELDGAFTTGRLCDFAGWTGTVLVVLRVSDLG